MEAILRILSLVSYFVFGSWLAYRWVFLARKDGAVGGKIAFIIVAWIGVFILGIIQNRISIEYFDSADFPEDQGLPAEVAYDSVGNNVFALFFGWIPVMICIGIARLFQSKQVE